MLSNEEILKAVLPNNQEKEIEESLNPLLLITHSEVDKPRSVLLPLDPDFLSIYLDFRFEVKLDIYDANLTADSVIALRIAFKYFVHELYQMNFNVTEVYQSAVAKIFEPDGSAENQHDTLTSSLNALEKALSEERNVSR
ncbi:hypothetical protein RhiirC2_791228 [Rhizophagus irregularis]|uniref:Uncharacterized protein n=1 Tax=Rhizophagus irregularis TaxID=588596 RepID=A0A2N1MJM5_9GLOM|nr:hypothetical protein RhiirC2_791228 [Rhizophagus irregularis]